MPSLARPPTTAIPFSPSTTRPTFAINKDDRSYKQQYANLYWLRLAVLRPKAAKRAEKLWRNMQGVDQAPKQVKRVLDVEHGKLCYVVGTIYMDMSLKPNVLEDLARENYLTAPPPRKKFFSSEDEIMLEDESGRVRLVGDLMESEKGTFVSGTIIAALGAETHTGDFEVAAICYPGFPPPRPKPSSSSKDKGKKVEDEEEGEWVALISGLEMGDNTEADDLRNELLVEYLLGELGGAEEKEESRLITRVILAGNSMATPTPTVDNDPKKKRYGYDSTLYTSAPSSQFDDFLSSLLPSLPVTLLPGESDPSGATMPQQPLHPALFTKSSEFAFLEGATNPAWVDIGGKRMLGTSGQTLDDVFKYLKEDSRLDMAIKTLEWAHIAPTCPDTLWCYPFADHDPFILLECPDIYFIGNQPKFETALVEQEDSTQGSEGSQRQVRVILIPKFKETGELVLVNTKTLDVKLVEFGLGGP